MSSNNVGLGVILGSVAYMYNISCTGCVRLGKQESERVPELRCARVWDSEGSASKCTSRDDPLPVHSAG